MVKKYTKVILLVSLIIGFIHGIFITPSFNIFVTWFLIGSWLIFSIKIIKNIKKYREFNSPHNTGSFIVFPILIAIFYTIWSNFTGLFVENLLVGSSLYLSWWSLVFGFPYVLYGSLALHFCFRKYNIVYLGKKSINARKFGYIMTFLIFTIIICYWAIFYVSSDIFESIISPIHFSVDLMLLLFFVNSLLIMIVSGLLRTQRSLPELTRNYITSRSNRLKQMTRPQPVRKPTRKKESARSTVRIRTPEQTKTITHRARSTSHSSRSSPNPQRKTTQTSSKATTRRISTTNQTRKTLAPKPKSKKITNLNQYKPKTTILSADDFKCIFCFQLPKLPKDKGRGIILCPKCGFPAHADEFKDWLHSSKLCSRCNATISASFQRNPNRISVKNYLIVYRDFLKKKK